MISFEKPPIILNEKQLKEGKEIEWAFINCFRELVNPSDARIWHANEEDDCRGGVDWWVEIKSIRGCLGVQVSTDQTKLFEKLRKFWGEKLRHWSAKSSDLLLGERGKLTPFYFWLDPVAFDKWREGDTEAGHRIVSSLVGEVSRQFRDVSNAGGLPLRIKIEALPRHIPSFESSRKIRH